MLPFSTADHRIGSSPLPFEERRVLRRSAPERLRFDPPSPGGSLRGALAVRDPQPARSSSPGRFARFAAMVRLWAPA
ncbi:hypothetical protein Rumeso_00744 [Rubellimicrobium mesophilum DSM 19309]|uniref:Uncharacterized protein n=1 Tax=Rubellimicrobium mesophilum DSM 19309 TaxID=442562 RepID=A0A017HTX7_9RHOB|nr:hypothetical protein Rumeso_00744 [Rubellimicrobium mesophilum DSM 19309]